MKFLFPQFPNIKIDFSIFSYISGVTGKHVNEVQYRDEDHKNFYSALHKLRNAREGERIYEKTVQIPL